jgi:hypothetical protein
MIGKTPGGASMNGTDLIAAMDGEPLFDEGDTKFWRARFSMAWKRSPSSVGHPRPPGPERGRRRSSDSLLWLESSPAPRNPRSALSHPPSRRGDAPLR